MKAQWAVARTQPGKEGVAFRNVVNQGHEAYLPRVRCPLRKKFVGLFPGYMFVKIERDGLWSHLKNTRGVSGLIMSTDGPAKLPTPIIRELKKQFGKEGFGPDQPAVKLQPGMKAKIKGGQMSGGLAIFKEATSEGRVRVLLNLLGKQIPVVVKRKHLEAA